MKFEGLKFTKNESYFLFLYIISLCSYGNDYDDLGINSYVNDVEICVIVRY